MAMQELAQAAPKGASQTVSTPHVYDLTRDEVEAARLTADALARKMTEFHAYYAMTPAIMHSIDATGRIVEVSDLWLQRFGYRRDQVIGRASTEFLTEESRRRAIEVALPAFWKAGRCERAAYEFVAADGSVVEVELSAELVEIAGQQLSLAVLDDVSERNAAARRLQEANDVLRQFAGLASHDLRGPLGKIARLSDLLRCEMSDDQSTAEERSHLLGRIGDTAREMSALVDAILDLSTGAEQADTFGAAPLESVIEGAKQELAADLEKSGATIILDLGADTAQPPLRGDPRLLKHLFANLIDNAIKHSGRTAPIVSIAARMDGVSWTIEVSDNGAGVSAEIAGALFRNRVHGDTRADGFGMGMLLARRIVDGHGGTIELAPPVVGDGARFILRLPACV